MTSAEPAGERTGRSAPRWHIDANTLAVLEAVFKLEQFPNIETRKQLGQDLNVSSRQIQVWFQNRRQRERKLKSMSDLRSLSSTSLSSSEHTMTQTSGDRSCGIPMASLPDVASGIDMAAMAPLDFTLRSDTAKDSPVLGLHDDLVLGDLPPLGPSFGEDLTLIDPSTATLDVDEIEPSLLSRTGSPSSSTGAIDHSLGELQPPTIEQQVSEATRAGATALVAASTAAIEEAGTAEWDALAFDHFDHDMDVSGALTDASAALPESYALPQTEGCAKPTKPTSQPEEEPMPSIAVKLAAVCQSSLIGRTLSLYGGVVQAITEAIPPYRVLSVSSGWEKLCGYSCSEACGKSLKILQGPATDPAPIAALMRAVRECRPSLVRLINYTKAGASYDQQLSVEPLHDPSGKTRCFQATSLILRRPGERKSAVLDARESSNLPIISNDRLPPLWPVLARAVRPDSAKPAISPTPLRSPTTAPMESAGTLAPHTELDQEILTWLESDTSIDVELDAFVE